MKRFVLLLFLFWVSSPHVYAGCWTFEGTFLYVNPSVDDTYFVITNTETNTNPIGNRENNDFDFYPAFRIGGTFHQWEYDRAFKGYFTRLRAEVSKTLTGLLYATVGSPQFSGAFQELSGLARSDLDLLYERIDLLCSQGVYHCRGLSLSLQGGLEYVLFHLNENYYFNVTDSFGDDFFGTANLFGKTWGIGPEVGVEMEYSIGWCPGHFSLVSCVSGSLLAARTRGDETDNNVTSGGIVLQVSDRHSWRVIPAAHIRAGLRYGSYFCYGAASLEIGYQFDCYSRLLRRMLYSDFDAGTGTSTYYNFGLQGLYLSGHFTF